MTMWTRGTVSVLALCLVVLTLAGCVDEPSRSGCDQGRSDRASAISIGIYEADFDALGVANWGDEIRGEVGTAATPILYLDGSDIDSIGTSVPADYELGFRVSEEIAQKLDELRHDPTTPADLVYRIVAGELEVQGWFSFWRRAKRPATPEFFHLPWGSLNIYWHDEQRDGDPMRVILETWCDR